MRTRDITITAALCGSLIAHWGLVYSLTQNEIRDLERRTSLGPIDQRALFGDKSKPARADADLPELTPTLPETARIELPQPEAAMSYEDVFGEHGGKGKSINSAPGERPMQAQHADEDQAFLNHNPNADITRSGASTPPGAAAGAAGAGGQGGDSAPGDSPPPPPAGGAAPRVAIRAETAKELENEPFGVPTAPPPSLMPPAPLAMRLPMIAIDAPREKLLPTTRRLEERPLNPTTRSVATRDQSPATRPVENDPGARQAEVHVAFVTPATQPAVDPATTRPTQIALEPVKIQGPHGVLPTTRESLAHLPTTLPATQPVRPSETAVASIGEVPHPETQLPEIAPPPPSAEAPMITMRQTGSSGSQRLAGTPGSPGTPGTTGGPAGSEGGNKSESESDPFSSEKNDNFVYINGHVAAHDGRKVKTVRPHIGEAARRDLMAMENPRVDLLLRIDTTGKVRDVQIVPGRSSGSEAVDLSAIRAAFEWEFEPPLDRTGHPRPDVQVVPFVWR